MIATNNNTTFFLGAGFSKAAGAPTQAEILKLVLSYNGPDYGNPITTYKQRLKRFLTDAFHLRKEQIINFNLEDFYTPIDKCVAENSSFRGYSVDYIAQIRNELSILISIVIDQALINADEDREFVYKLCNYVFDSWTLLNDDNSRRANIITTNWDIVVDNMIFERGPLRKEIDYGTKYYFHDDDDDFARQYPRSVRKPVRLYKIHGSLNWLKCPSCNRLFVNRSTKIGIQSEALKSQCRFCQRNFKMRTKEGNGFSLEPQIIYPTFLKDLNNIHIRSIWEAAAEVMSETSKLIFIGYSFPQADFEVRQLLARRVPSNCEILCVLNGDPPDRKSNFWATPQARYENFFGQRNVKFFYCGASDFILNELDQL
jgi:NAD-dependent SIR2 family protein deacetylase